MLQCKGNTVGERMNEIIITKIEWERIFLRIYINFSNGKQFGLFNDKKNRFIPIVPVTETCFEINTTCVFDRKFLDNGDWKFGYFKDEVFIPSLVSEEVAYQYDTLSRIFRYGKGRQYAYTVDFDVIPNEEDSKLYFVLRSYFVKANTSWKKRKYIE